MIKRLIIAVCFLVPSMFQAVACTSAIIGAEANPYGRPILWKHRDTSTIDNKVEYVLTRPGEHSYVALFNAGDKKLQEAWMGMNDAGFAIMNTASYNLKDDKVSSKLMDKEGFVMTKALKNCTTVDDFEELLKKLPRPMGVEANFGVIDAYGNGAYFETNNHSFKRFDLKDAENHILVRTNYSKSGRPDEGFGFVREANACHLLAPYAEKGEVTPELLTETLSRSFWHDMKQRDYAEGPDRWVIDQDFIPRFKSTATIAIEGCKPIRPGEKPEKKMIEKEYIMWTGLGYPPCSEIEAVRCSPDGVDAALRGTLPNGHSAQGDKVKARRAEVFPITKGNGEKYIDMSKLYNSEGSGYVQKLVPKNLETYAKERAIRDNN